jgi:hypothetical protein
VIVSPKRDRRLTLVEHIQLSDLMVIDSDQAALAGEGLWMRRMRMALPESLRPPCEGARRGPLRLTSASGRTPREIPLARVEFLRDESSYRRI